MTEELKQNHLKTIAELLVSPKTPTQQILVLGALGGIGTCIKLEQELGYLTTKETEVIRTKLVEAIDTINNGPID